MKDPVFVKLSYHSHPTLWKCETKSPEWPFKCPDHVAFSNAPTSDIPEMAAKENPLLIYEVHIIFKLMLDYLLCRFLTKDAHERGAVRQMSLNSAWGNQECPWMHHHGEITIKTIELPSNNNVNLTKICTLYQMWWKTKCQIYANESSNHS